MLCGVPAAKRWGDRYLQLDTLAAFVAGVKERGAKRDQFLEVVKPTG